MLPDQAPQVPSLQDRINTLIDQIAEANANYDSVRAWKLEQEKNALVAQLDSSIDKTQGQAPQVPSLQDRINTLIDQIAEANANYDSVRAWKLEQEKNALVAQLDMRFSVAPAVSESMKIPSTEPDQNSVKVLKDEPLHDEHVKVRLMRSMENLIDNRAQNFFSIFFGKLSQNDMVGAVSDLAFDQRSVSFLFHPTEDNAKVFLHGAMFGSTIQEVNEHVIDGLKVKLVREYDFPQEIVNLMFANESRESKKEKLSQLIQQFYPDISEYMGTKNDVQRTELEKRIKGYKERKSGKPAGMPYDGRWTWV